MPSDANGVHTLPVGYLAEDGETIQPSQHNPPLEDLSSGLTERLMRSGVAPMTGPLKLADGSASAPALAFNSDPTFGFYKTAVGIAATKPIIGVLPIGLGPLPWTGTTAPPGWVLCYGQTLSRAVYADLWAFAQIQIAASNPMYNNGNGTTTFGILDMRGRVAATYGALGGSDSGRLTGNFGSGIGAELRVLTSSNMPSHNHAVYLNDQGHSHTYGPDNLTSAASGAGLSEYWFGSNPSHTRYPTRPATTGITISSAPGGAGQPNATEVAGSGTAFSLIQPTLVTSAILYAGV